SRTYRTRAPREVAGIIDGTPHVAEQAHRSHRAVPHGGRGRGTVMMRTTAPAELFPGRAEGRGETGYVLPPRTCTFSARPCIRRPAPASRSRRRAGRACR